MNSSELFVWNHRHFSTRYCAVLITFNSARIISQAYIDMRKAAKLLIQNSGDKCTTVLAIAYSVYIFVSITSTIYTIKMKTLHCLGSMISRDCNNRIEFIFLVTITYWNGTGRNRNQIKNNSTELFINVITNWQYLLLACFHESLLHRRTENWNGQHSMRFRIIIKCALNKCKWHLHALDGKSMHGTDPNNPVGCIPVRSILFTHDYYRAPRHGERRCVSPVQSCWWIVPGIWESVDMVLLDQLQQQQHVVGRCRRFAIMWYIVGVQARVVKAWLCNEGDAGAG